jgi:hypothetical protein
MMSSAPAWVTTSWMKVAAVTDALARIALLHAIRFAAVRRAPLKRFR